MDAKVTGVVLAGGLGRRMGGADKGLLPLGARTMVEQVIERFRPQVDELLISANQNLERYAAFGHRVIPDAVEGFAGPLAGFERGFALASHELVATVPCDSPFLPADLVVRLRAALAAHGAQIAVARTPDGPHPVFCLCQRELHASLRDYLAAGGRKIDRWYGALRAVEVPFDDQAQAFGNINTRDDLAAAQRASTR